MITTSGNPFDLLLYQLFDEGIVSVQAMRLLVYVQIPRSFAEIEAALCIERMAVNRMIRNCPGLIIKYQLAQDERTRGRGRPAVAIEATARGKHLMAQFLGQP